MADGSAPLPPRPLPAFASGALDEIRARVEAYNRADISQEICPADGGMHLPPAEALRIYWTGGASAMEAIFQALLAARAAAPRRILDLGCGYGRLVRHLVAAFPEAEVTASDIDPHGVHFCATRFGAVPASSVSDFRLVSFPQPFDLIWSGSLFSHLPEDKFKSCLNLVSRSLAPGGVAVLTLHGRYCSVIGRGAYLPDERFDALRATYDANGFGYADYSDEPSWATGNYGIALSSPAFVMKALEADASVRVLSYAERGYADHQDIVVLQKHPIFA